MASSWFWLSSREISRLRRKAPQRQTDPTQKRARAVQPEMWFIQAEKTGTAPTAPMTSPSRHQATAKSEVIRFSAWSQKLTTATVRPTQTIPYLMTVTISILHRSFGRAGKIRHQDCPPAACSGGSCRRSSSRAKCPSLWYTLAVGLGPLFRLIRFP